MVKIISPAPSTPAICTTREQICTNCAEPESSHCHDGNFCPIFDHDHALMGFSGTNKFTPTLGWKVGDVYTSLKYENLVIVGIVAEIGHAGHIYGWETITFSRGGLESFRRACRSRGDIVRMVPA